MKKRRPLRPLSLQFQLLLGNILVLVISIGSLIAIVRPYKAELFQNQLLEGAGTSTDPNDQKVLRIFQQVNNQGTAVALVVVGIGIGTVNWWLTRSILQPLKNISIAAKALDQGDFSQNIPPATIPELHQLGLTLNSVAARLTDVEQRRREMVGDLAHELATPLTVVKGYVDMALAEQIQFTPELLEHINAEIERMTRLLSDLQLLSQVEAGKLPMQLQALSPQKTLHALFSTIQPHFNTQCQLQLDCPNFLPAVYADPDRLKQILLNLIRNAVQHTAQGSVTVRVWAAEKAVWFEVEDTGSGIASEDLPFVFNRFWRSRRSQVSTKGTGLGLSIAQRLVSVQNGEIFVDSTLGKGSKFKFYLPTAN